MHGIHEQSVRAQSMRRSSGVCRVERERERACWWMGDTERVFECALQWYLHPCTAKSTAPKSTAQEWERAQQCQWVSKHLQQGRKESCKLCIVETKACIKDLTYEGGRDVSHTFANGGGGGIATYINVVGIYVVGRGVVFHWLQDHSRMIVYSAKQSKVRIKTLSVLSVCLVDCDRFLNMHS